MRNYLLISSSRSGTNFFLDIFKRLSPCHLALGEVFRKTSDSLSLINDKLSRIDGYSISIDRSDPVLFWRELQERSNAQNLTLMAKIFYYHVPWEDRETWLALATGCGLFHLYRRNLFNSYVSLELARSSKQWKNVRRKSASIASEPTKITLDRERLEKFIALRKRCALEAIDRFSHLDLVGIAYEDIEASPAKAASVIAGLVGIDSFPQDICSSLLRQKTCTNGDVVVNYSDLADLDVDHLSF